MSNLVKLSSAVVAAASLMLSACNSSDDTTVINDPTDNSSTAITAFSLKTNKDVLNNLDSVYFSIDLNAAIIFNADSLPYGTDVSALSVNLTTAGGGVKAFSPNADGTETAEIDLAAEPSTKLNFSQGPVRVLITSLDGEHQREYHVGVNVHKVVPDSLFWSQMARTSLPTVFSDPTAQKSVKLNEKAYCLTTDGSGYAMAVSSDPYANAWQTTRLAISSALDVKTFSATDDALYILAADGSLLTSADGLSWTSTGTVWKNIIGGFGSKLLGIAASGSADTFVSHPASVSGSVPADFPVSGFSDPVSFSTKWAQDGQIMIFGGLKSDGAPTGATWAYDGTQWARIAESLPAASGYAVTACTICETDTVSWRLKETDVLLAFGGTLADGQCNGNVYLSRDMGITWKKGDSYLQLPKYMPATSGADILVFYTTAYNGFFSQGNSARSGGRRWIEMPVAQLPSIYLPGAAPLSRAVAPVTTWDCPFLYMFGGTDAHGTLQNVVWRGVVNHFTFQPLQ